MNLSDSNTIYNYKDKDEVEQQERELAGGITTKALKDPWNASMNNLFGIY